MTNKFTRQLAASSRQLLRDAIKTSYDLFKIIVPLSIITKLLTDWGVTDYLGLALGPVMELVGLPGSMGLVWATAMVTNIYGAIIVFAALAPTESLTAAQVTVLATMLLVAHGLPVEVRITQVAGLRPWFIALFRVICALVLGGLLNQIYSRGDFLQAPHQALWNPPPQDSSWWGWTQTEVKNLLMIFLIILGLLAIMRLLEWIGVITLLKKLLGPVLAMLGMSQAATPTTIIGMTLGLSFGGGLIIQEARSGRLSKQDVFFSLALLSICHSFIEDTLLMMVVGGHLSGILWGRVLFSLLVIFLLVKIVQRLPEPTFSRFLIRKSWAG
ncbi:MAG: hypothetical protein JXM69_17050 [Anaerolineae bacterium]|nr:hypothetical protein [Anaerolineae bacterium]